MNKFKAILLCYGKVALTMNFELKYKAVNYTTWMIEGIETREELLKKYSKKQIILIYESGY
ncbi:MULTISPECIES: hypothetical protein [Aliarcobacter]|jgi:hypothetical protein|uniref:Uncharacterized protein n=3 Tax=Arcobacteraceae TaxID=2808963 RepID=A0A2S9T8S3_9BACT|nr:MULTISPECIES: hypothetical protein [Aliarcobacter]WNL11790.1 hypothetical protein RJG52_07590 [Arcobacter sp. AZ-2023]WPD10405.1 hypothetical protein QUR77_03330 [Arcobacter sp. DSM 115954]MCT7528188.1 hypothetical protein [Aliarcobacter cryaerophilus]PRM95245.1 hypothetical protein CJ670_09535 [Arcobacter cryaerophilus gv. crypticus]WNL15235.1 hypothetical protein RJG51_03340 [Arcobacter sp. AZ-2023]